MRWTTAHACGLYGANMAALAPILTDLDKSLVSILADLIREAVLYLMRERRYSLDQLCYITGGGTRAAFIEAPQQAVMNESLHKNSLLKVTEMRRAPTVMTGEHRGRKIWKEVKDLNTRGLVVQWLWSPQIETIEKLELLLQEAIREGYRPESMLVMLPRAAVGFPTQKTVALPARRRRRPAAESKPSAPDTPPPPPATPAPTPAPVVKAKPAPKAKAKGPTKPKPRGKKKRALRKAA